MRMSVAVWGPSFSLAHMFFEIAFQVFLERPTWEELVESRKLGFYQRILNGQQLSLARALLF